MVCMQMVEYIIYNNNTRVYEEEIESYNISIYYFWLRFIQSVTNNSCNLHQLQDIIGVTFDPKEHYNLRWAKQIILNKFNMDPFSYQTNNTSTTTEGWNDNKAGWNDYPLVIAVDEFTHILDCTYEKWSYGERVDFLNSFKNNMCTKPFVKFVFTGFNHNLNYYLEPSSASIYYITLTLCDYTAAKPLLRMIVNEYIRINRRVPMVLYEVVKSTPGLIGLWAERLLKSGGEAGHIDGQIIDDSFANFAFPLPWIRVVTDKEDIYTNWQLIIQYFICFELDEHMGGVDERARRLGDLGQLVYMYSI